MSLVDIPPLPAEDEIMDPATKQYVDSSAAIAEARNDVKIAEFRAVMETYAARADERELAAKERDDIRHNDLERRMGQFEATVASVKRAVITTGIVATLSTVFGVAAFNAALMQNIFAALEAGRQATPAQVRMLADFDEIKRELTDLRAAKGR